jgi:hypothetical protein
MPPAYLQHNEQQKERAEQLVARRGWADAYGASTQRQREANPMATHV